MGTSTTQSKVAPKAPVVHGAQGLAAVRAFAPEGERAGAAQEGGARVGFSFGRLPIQAKLIVGQAGDKLEAEADQVADRVMRMPDPKATGGVVQRKCEGCEEDAKVQRKGVAGAVGGVTAPPIVHAALQSPGQPLDAQTRSFMEPRFGHDFAGVRVHTAALAGASAEALRANAYTVGSDIVFAGGLYTPHSQSGDRLLAHELTHVIQQSGGQTQVQRDATGQTTDPTGQTTDPNAKLDLQQSGQVECHRDFSAVR
jgi:hypothetical protein